MTKINRFEMGYNIAQTIHTHIEASIFNSLDEMKADAERILAICMESRDCQPYAESQRGRLAYINEQLSK